MIAGGGAAVAGFDEGGDIPVAVEGRMMAFRTLADGEQAADATGTLHRSAEVGAPHEVVQHGIVSIQFGDQVPAVVEEAAVDVRRPCRAAPMPDLLADAAAVRVVGIFEFALRGGGHAFEGFLLDEAVFGVPCIVPASVGFEVALPGTGTLAGIDFLLTNRQFHDQAAERLCLSFHSRVNR